MGARVQIFGEHANAQANGTLHAARLRGGGRALRRWPSRLRAPRPSAAERALTLWLSFHRYAPNSRPEQVQQILSRLFDHLVGAQHDRLRKHNAERLCSTLVDGKFELCWLLDR